MGINQKSALRVGWIVHGPAKWESNCHREVSVVYQRLEAEDCLEFFYRFSVVCRNQGIEFIDDVVDTCDAVLTSRFISLTAYKWLWVTETVPWGAYF